jgi:hypothetical protein
MLHKDKQDSAKRATGSAWAAFALSIAMQPLVLTADENTPPVARRGGNAVSNSDCRDTIAAEGTFDVIAPDSSRPTDIEGVVQVDATAPIVPPLVAVASNGIVTLNVSTGAVNFCVGFTYLNTGVPFGKCKKLGAIVSTGLTGNARLDITSNSHAFITNVSTGAVLICYLGFDTWSGIPTGSCYAQKLQP